MEPAMADQQQPAAAHPEQQHGTHISQLSSAAAQPAQKERAKGVTFSAEQLEDDGAQTKVLDLLKPKEGRQSQAEARRRRMLRRAIQRLNPRYWLLVLDKTLPIINPSSRGRVVWDTLIMLLVIYNCILVPYQVGFSTPAPHIIEPLGYAVDSIFFMDILLNFRTAYMDKTATLVRVGRTIASNYVRTWFAIDLASTIPFDALIQALGNGLNQTQLAAFALLRTPRLLRLLRLFRILDRMKGANAVRMLKLMFLMAALAHWLACLWHLLAEVFSTPDQPWSFNALGPDAADITLYLHGYLNTLYIMIGNDGSPENDLERLYCTFVLILGACFYAIVVGNMSLLINNMNPTASRHKFKKDLVNNTIRYLGLPQDLTRRINVYFDYLTQYSHPGSDGMALVSQLPSSMAQDINSWFYRDLIKSVPMFHECEDAFITQLVMRLKLMVFMTGEVIFNVGDVGHEMYFIVKGNVAVVNSNQELLAVLSKGGFFGELALLATARRTACCISVAQCDLSMLQANDLVNAMRDFPDSAAKVRERAMNRLNELQTGGQIQEPHHHPAPAHLKQLNPDAAVEEEEGAWVCNDETCVRVGPLSSTGGGAVQGSTAVHSVTSVSGAPGIGGSMPTTVSKEQGVVGQQDVESRNSPGEAGRALGSTSYAAATSSKRASRGNNAISQQELGMQAAQNSRNGLQSSHTRSGRLMQQGAVYTRTGLSGSNTALGSRPEAGKQYTAPMAGSGRRSSLIMDSTAKVLAMMGAFSSAQDWMAGNAELIAQVHTLVTRVHAKMDVLDDKREAVSTRVQQLDASIKHSHFEQQALHGAAAEQGMTDLYDHFDM